MKGVFEIKLPPILHVLIWVLTIFLVFTMVTAIVLANPMDDLCQKLNYTYSQCGELQNYFNHTTQVYYTNNITRNVTIEKIVNLDTTEFYTKSDIDNKVSTIKLERQADLNELEKYLKKLVENVNKTDILEVDYDYILKRINTTSSVQEDDLLTKYTKMYEKKKEIELLDSIFEGVSSSNSSIYVTKQDLTNAILSIQKPAQQEQPSQQAEQKSNPYPLIIIFLIVLVLGLGGFLLYKNTKEKPQPYDMALPVFKPEIKNFDAEEKIKKLSKKIDKYFMDKKKSKVLEVGHDEAEEINDSLEF